MISRNAIPQALLKEQVKNNFPIWDGFGFRANRQRSYSPVRRAGKIVAQIILIFDLKGSDCVISGLNQTFVARKPPALRTRYYA